MLEAVGLIGGAVTRFIPLVLDFFKEGRNLKYELQRMEKEVELERLRGQNARAEIDANASAAVDAQWALGLVEALRAQGQVTGDTWLDRINVSVRPILTFWWCIFMYTLYKVSALWVAIVREFPLEQWPTLIATEFDRTVIASIMAFWFVDRSLRAHGVVSSTASKAGK